MIGIPVGKRIPTKTNIFLVKRTFSEARQISACVFVTIRISIQKVCFILKMLYSGV
jgi:hypothetical protein